MFAENLVALGWVSCSLFPMHDQFQPTKEYLLWEKVAQMPLLNYFFLGLGWPSVVEFVGVIKMCTDVPGTSKYMFSNPT